jgi:protein CpxP
MKRLILTLAIAAFAFTGSFAQQVQKDKLSPAQKAEKTTAKLQKELSLSAAQKQKIYAIELNKANKAEEWHAKNHDAKKTMKAQHEELKKSTDEEISKVLTPEQNKKLMALKAAKKDKAKNKSKRSEKKA